MTTTTRRPGVPVPDWELASCREQDAELFYPNEASGFDWRSPKAICNGTDRIAPCEIRDGCLAWAVETEQRDGVWGGMSEKPRQRLIAAKRRRAQEASA